jgi:hypothetical protein
MRKLLLYVVVALVLECFLTACARKMNFARSVVMPSAEGKVKVKKDRNDNYAIDVSVLHLAEPNKLQPPKQAYVVWMHTSDNEVKNIGQLKSSSGLLSRTLKASLNAVSSSKPTRFFITAEEAADVQYPGLQTVLVTE